MSAPRVLVVDDDRAVRESLRRALQLEDLEVGVAADGIEALAHIRRSPPDLLVVDGQPDPLDLDVAWEEKRLGRERTAWRSMMKR